MYKKQVAVEELELGMYVIELDRPWLGTPFALQGFPITSQDQIEHAVIIACGSPRRRRIAATRFSYIGCRYTGSRARVGACEQNTGGTSWPALSLLC